MAPNHSIERTPSSQPRWLEGLADVERWAAGMRMGQRYGAAAFFLGGLSLIMAIVVFQ